MESVMGGQQVSPGSLMALVPKKQLAFALLIFERMLPSLTVFSKDTGFDDSCYLRAKDEAWRALQDSVVDHGLNQLCVRRAPDTEKFSHELTSYALNAALAMGDIMEFTLDSRTDHIRDVATLATDSVDLYLSSLVPPVVSFRIASHPLMHQEKRREEEDIKFLSELPDRFDDDAIRALRARAGAQLPLLPLSPDV